MSPAVQATLDRLEDARQRWWTYSLLCNVVLVILLSLAALVLFIMTDVWLRLPPLGLWTLLVVWVTFSVVLFFRCVYRVFFGQRSLEAAARRVELSFPELGSHLINLIQLSHSREGSSDAYCLAAIEEAARQVDAIRFQTASERQSRWQRWRLGLQTPRDLLDLAGVLAGVVMITAGLNALVPSWRSSADRLFTPWRFVPQVGSVQILEVTPGDAEVVVGARLEIAAVISDPGGRRPEATLFVRQVGEKTETVRTMIPDEQRRRFTYTLPSVSQPLQYRLEVGDSQSEIYQVGVRQMPALREVAVMYRYPAYLAMPELMVRQKHADLDAPQYTEAELELTSSTPLARGHAQLADHQVAGRVDADDPHVLRLRLPLQESTSYTIHLYNELGHTDAQPRVHKIRVSPDQPPTVRIAKPARESRAALGSELPIVVRASDDYGLGAVRLEWKRDLGTTNEDDTPAEDPVSAAAVDEAIETLRTWDQVQGTTSATLTHVLTFDPGVFAADETVLVRATATDRRRLTVRNRPLSPQQASSDWIRIQLVPPEQEAAETLERLESIGARLWAILQKQIRARVATAELAQQEDAEDFSRIVQGAAVIRRLQVEVQTSTADLATAIEVRQGEADATLKQALAKLAHGEMIRAAQQAEALADVRAPAALPELGTPLMASQDRVIEILRKLLEWNRRASSEALTEWKDRPGGDLPSDVAAKLEELAEKLDEFIKQQKRVIEATENLAKKPVEDFTEEEKQLLEELAATEDEWARFMEEMHSDFSKLPEQDFANPSLLEELVEIQTELKMAADALTKKSAEIAVPLEQLGAEMAEELTSNIEKWLPDTPDRERWSQEEPLSDEMKEAPMAELPGELEDLVGELMEEEEALFDEMEDLSSSWADSLDKGAGWDAADGPISNMSAKGVTGNRLPNTSEIGGRSGEGRQGKASGEFVGDTAVGKGGRKTPSRLAPDPFVKGQVQDFSKDPVGGATGGGKESGVGGEGLEGPVAEQSQRDMQRLATKQADLRNRAEAVDVQFQVLNYHHTDLERMIDMMEAVETDLRSGRYESALRRREVLLEGLDNIKTYLDGEYEVRRDQTSNLPEDIQKELLGSMQEASPLGWEALNRKYFESLSSPSPNTSPPPNDQSTLTP